MRIELEPAYVLHTRPYRDTSLLVDLFTQHYGRLTVVAKGVRKAKSAQRYLLQPFIPLQTSWIGNRSLKNLTNVESTGQAYHLEKKYLYSGLYANELLSYLLAEYDENAIIFSSYQKLLVDLSVERDLEIALRQFELSLLTELGYGIDFETDAYTGHVIQETENYYFVENAGFIEKEIVCSSHAIEVKNNELYEGAVLLKLGRLFFDDNQVKVTAKKIIRQALAPHLKGKEIKSRKLFKR